ncbi:MAG: hypothetical protein R3E64_04320 [Halioglobus sp.]
MWLRSLLVAVVISVGAGCDAYVSGDNSQGQLGLGTAGNAGYLSAAIPWSMLEAGPVTTCGINVAKELWCWGDNSRGQTGNGSVGGNQVTPNRVGTATDWSRVSPGARHTCGIRAGQLWCWGSNAYGQIGNNASNTAVYSSPQRIGTASDWKSVSLGQYHSCGIRGAGNLYCWGLNTYGQVGNGSNVNAFLPQLVSLGPWASVDAGESHTCAIRKVQSGALLCWGSNEHGELGTTYVPVGGLLTKPLFGVPLGDPANDGLGNSGVRTWSSVSAGTYLSCAILKVIAVDPDDDIPESRTLWCWGNNDYQQIPEEPAGVDVLQPALVGKRAYIQGQYAYRIQAMYSSVSVGGEHMCTVNWGQINVISSLSTLETVTGAATGYAIPDCFGSNDNNQLGVGNLAKVVSVSAGFRFSTALIAIPPPP